MNNKNIIIGISLTLTIVAIVILVLAIVLKGKEMFEFLMCCWKGKKKDVEDNFQNDQKLNQQQKNPNENAIKILNAQIEETKKLQKTLENMIQGTDRILESHRRTEESLNNLFFIQSQLFIEEAKEIKEEKKRKEDQSSQINLNSL